MAIVIDDVALLTAEIVVKEDTYSPFYEHGLNLIPAWISNHKPSKVYDEVNYPFLNFNSATVGV